MSRPWPIVVLALGFLAPATAVASSPSSDSLAPSSTSITWVGTAVGGTNQGGEEGHDAQCVEGANCDTFVLEVEGTPGEWAGKSILLKIDWGLLSTDYDFYV